ncbi:MAG: hypoxanthine-guanine phosphoribosyltransferase [Sulfuricella sp.]|nr:hypoxanthine-guanine phosphoribosyltransferase [Sulfuricella sp.]
MIAEEAWKIYREADLICSAEEVQSILVRLAGEIGAELRDSHPLVLSVMGGAVVFSGQLLPMLEFPLDFDYIHVTRYGNRTSGGELEWKVLPKENIAGRVVLVLDDILDEGHTLAAIREKIMGMGAKAFFCAVFAAKDTGKSKPIQANFAGVDLPNRYVFGYGMDVHGAWRNLPAIYAVKGK